MATRLELIPAIDLLDGHVVRLAQGKRDQRTIYSSDPVAFAHTFEEAGATRLHVVDLNGAFDGKFANLDLVRAIRKGTKMRVELGGGVRSLSDAQTLWDAGVDDVIIGTRAVEDIQFVGDLLKRDAGRVIIGIDARDGYVATRGWTEYSSIAATDFARRVHELGCRKIIYTDIATDGMLSGPNLDALCAMAREVPQMEVIASGGISSLADLQAVRDLKLPNVTGIISGRALYDGRMDLASAVRILSA